MIFVITGAASFIGLEFTKLILECGHNVIAVCREESKSIGRLPEGPALTLVCCSMRDYGELPSKIGHADVFVNFAWDGTSVEGRFAAGVQKQNVEAAQIAVRVAHQMGCRLFVEAGSQAEYGVVNGIITENTPCHPFSEYGKAKLAVKDAGFKLSAELGIKYLHLRIFSVFGEYDHPHTLFMNAVGKMLTNAPLDLSPCIQKWNYLYVRDAVRQICFLCEKAVGDEGFTHEVFNVASEDTRTLSEFVERIKFLLHSTSSLNYGVFVPEHLVTLNPDITKLKNYIGFVSDYTFDEAVKLTTDRMRKRKGKDVSLTGGNCLICGAPLGEDQTLFVCDNMPGSAQDIPTSDGLDNDHGIELRLVQCRQCGLVQIPTEPVPYYRKVIRAGGGTTTMVNLRKEQYSDLMSRFNLEGKKILEVGCGKGEFLRIWNEFDVRAVGIEYDQDLVRKARQEGLEVYKSYADNAFTELPEAPFDAFVQFNFLEHQPYPNDMLQCIYNNLTAEGVGLVTVPSLEYILKYDGYYELIKDHIAYYSEETLKFLFQKNGFEVLDMIPRNMPDVILMDIRMPEMDGVSCTKAVMEKYPSIKIIILTTFDDDEFVYSALRYGASGYLLKGVSMDELYNSIHTVVSGGAMINPNIAKKVFSLFSKMTKKSYSIVVDEENIKELSDPEWRVIHQVSLGLSNKEIAQELFLSEGTVRNYLSSILFKLDLRDRTQLAIWAVQSGLTSKDAFYEE